MKFLSAIAFSSLLLFTACDDDQVADQQPETDLAQTTMPLDFELTLHTDEAVVNGHLMLVPIKGDDDFFAYHAKLGNYLPLAKALEEGVVTVEETDQSSSNESSGRHGVGGNSSPFPSWNGNAYNSSRSGAAVNMLLARNDSETDTVYFMAGEVVDGGKQDRVLAQDLILPPGESADLSVFCVEHGRWQYEGNSSTFAWGAFAANSIRKKESQQAVWDDVKGYNEGVDARTHTGTYMAFKDNAEVKNEIEDQKQVFLAFADDRSTVGVLAVSGNTILGCDLFASHELFKSHYDGLLDGYLSEATFRGEAPVLSDEEMKAFFQKAQTGFKNRTIPEGSKGLIHANRNIHLAVFE